jgi:hypothetical protein
MLHTIHRKSDHSPYVLHILQKDQNYKTTMLAFQERKDAKMIAGIFEQYKLEYGHYPPNETTMENPLQIEYRSEHTILVDFPLTDIYVRSWLDQDLYTYCAMNFMDVMMVGDLHQKGRVRILGFEISSDFIRDKFERTMI